MDKKNTLLLTVIAVATLLVAIVGATFAYFTAQLGGGASAEITVGTKTADTTMFNSFGSLIINADQTNFGEETEFGGEASHSLYAETTGSVEFTSSNVNKDSKDYCYKVGLTVNTNNFVYSLVKTRSESQYYPELVLRLYKDAGSTQSSLNEASFKEYGQAEGINISALPVSAAPFSANSTVKGSTTVPYVSNILQSDKKGAQACLSSAKNASEETGCLPAADISGYDITVLGNSTATGADYKDETVLLIPSATGKYEHKLTATTGGSTAKDYWKVQVLFINYSDDDINTPDGEEKTNWEAKHGKDYAHYGDQNENAKNKSFTATLRFEPLTTCSEEA